MTSSLPNLMNNLAEGIHKIKCKYGQDDKKCKGCGINYKECNCSLGYTNFKENLTLHKLLFCNEKYQKVWWNFKEKVKCKFKIQIAYKFSNHDIDQIVLLLRRRVYPYKYMAYWEKSMKLH